MSNNYTTVICTEDNVSVRSTINLIEEDERVLNWSDFISCACGGHYSQTIEWGLTKSNRGWQSIRLMVLDQDDLIVAGAQVLLRPIPYISGYIGYISKGPLFLHEHPEIQIIDLFFKKLLQLTKEIRIRLLLIQPPNNGHFLIEYIQGYGFKENFGEDITPPGTAIIDLHQDLSSIYCKMKKKTRQSIRRGIENRYEIYECGSKDGVDCFYQILDSTSQRKGFLPDLQSTLQKAWELFYPKGWLKLFLLKYENEFISGNLVITFGDTVTGWRSGWNGKYNKKYPNATLEWETIQWGKNHGFHYYDLGGIHTGVAKCIMDGKPIPANMDDTVTNYKLGFSSEVKYYPGTYRYIYNPILEWACSKIFERILNFSFIQRILNLICRR